MEDSTGPDRAAIVGTIVAASANWTMKLVEDDPAFIQQSRSSKVLLTTALDRIEPRMLQFGIMRSSAHAKNIGDAFVCERAARYKKAFASVSLPAAGRYLENGSIPLETPRPAGDAPSY